LSGSRLLLVGLGRMGHLHLKAMATNPRLVIAGLCDLDGRPLEARPFPTWNRLDDALEAARPDGAVLAVPPAAHEDCARRCLAHGVPVLLEKPLTPRLTTSLALVRDFAAKGVPLMPAMVERFNPAWRRLPDLLPLIGELRGIHAVRHGTSSRPEHGIGVGLDLAVHDLDLLAGLLPQPELRGRTEAPDRVELRLETRDGIEAKVEARWDAPAARRRWRIRGTLGELVLDFRARTLHLDGTCAKVPEGDALDAQLAAFVRCVAREEQARLLPALKAQEWLESPTQATASISTSTLRGSRPTSMVERAGAGPSKNRP
jgi:predicted dehydrogenase